MFTIKNIKKIFKEESDLFQNIQLNNNNNNQKIFDNLLLIAKYNNRIHLISYLYLKQINQLLLLILIISSFITGLIEIINYKTNFNQDIYLIFGITDIFLSLIMVAYKNLKIPNSEQEHYQYHIHYKTLLNDINLNISIHNKPNFLYKNIDCYLIHINNQINKLNLTAPKIPDRVLTKYNIKNNTIINTNISDSSSNDSLQDIESNINTSQNISLYNINNLSVNDIENFKNFIDKIDNINSQKEYNNKFKKFNITSQLNKI